MTSEEIVGENYSMSCCSFEEKSLENAQASCKRAEKAPVKRMLLSMKQKMAFIQHFEGSKMTHAELEAWI